MNKHTFFVVCCIMLLLALLPMPYGYYQLLRLVVCGSCIFGVYVNYKRKASLDIALCLIALLYNPIFTIHFDRGIWTVLNIITVVYFAYLITQKK